MTNSTVLPESFFSRTAVTERVLVSCLSSVLMLDFSRSLGYTLFRGRGDLEGAYT